MKPPQTSQYDILQSPPPPTRPAVLQRIFILANWRRTFIPYYYYIPYKPSLGSRTGIVAKTIGICLFSIIVFVESQTTRFEYEYKKVSRTRKKKVRHCMWATHDLRCKRHLCGTEKGCVANLCCKRSDYAPCFCLLCVHACTARCNVGEI